MRGCAHPGEPWTAFIRCTASGGGNHTITPFGDNVWQHSGGRGMAYRNGPDRWGAVARLLHWGMALMILVEVPAGLIMSRTYGARTKSGAAWQFWSSNIHHTTGLLILLLALLRAGWRLAGPVPAPVATLSGPERRLALGTHALLYGLLILIPLSGWAALSSLADSPGFGRTTLWFFGTNGFDTVIPHLVPPVPWNSHVVLRYSTFARAHVWLLIGGAALLVLHIAAALRHHFVLQDRTLARMLHG